MRLSDTLSMATTALVGNPVRTLLTLLGILIGVGCVVSMAAIGAGAQAQVADQIFNDLGLSRRVSTETTPIGGRSPEPDSSSLDALVKQGATSR